MRYYQEITLIPNADIDRHFLLSKTFQQIHLGLVEMQDDQKRVPIGVSFPEYILGEKYSALGGKLRLFAPDETMLERFNTEKWLSRLSDYVHYTRIRPVPEAIKGYAVYRREQPKISKERLARRYAKRKNLDYELAFNEKVELSVKSEEGAGCKKDLMRYCDMPRQVITTPFVRLKSISSGHTFCLWINKKDAIQNGSGAFTTYGLSTASAVPEF